MVFEGKSQEFSGTTPIEGKFARGLSYSGEGARAASSGLRGLYRNAGPEDRIMPRVLERMVEGNKLYPWLIAVVLTTIIVDIALVWSMFF